VTAYAASWNQHKTGRAIRKNFFYQLSGPLPLALIKIINKEKNGRKSYHQNRTIIPIETSRKLERRKK
jgi:hypothetical protein